MIGLKCCLNLNLNLNKHESSIGAVLVRNRCIKVKGESFCIIEKENKAYSKKRKEGHEDIIKQGRRDMEDIIKQGRRDMEDIIKQGRRDMEDIIKQV